MSERTSLPAAYAPLEPALDALSQPLAEVLCGQLLQFEVLASGLETQQLAEKGEFEGLGGLTNRGQIEHILQSELLLRTEAPLEFLRRLAESETLFHDRIHADPGARNIWRVAISCGPGIVGHGRLVALAAIFFIARIAARRDAELHWCFLPREEGAVWFKGVNVNAIKRFLRSASFREADAGDLADARAAWSALHGEAAKQEKAEIADWVIGEGQEQGREENALAFAMRPAQSGEARECEVMLRRKGSVARHAAIRLMEDQLCLTALQHPFPRPVKQGAVQAEPGAKAPARAGWAPQYIAIPNQNFRLIRTDEGLLVVGRTDRRSSFPQSWFLPIGEDMMLAGAGVVGERLIMLFHRLIAGEQWLKYYSFPLPALTQKPLSAVLERKVPSEHLFRDHGRFAVPALSLINGVQFYSFAGSAYNLTSSRYAGESEFAADRLEERTVFASGMYRVVARLEKERPYLFVRNQNGSMRMRCPIAVPELPKSFHDMAWSTSEGALAYSLRPGIWRIASTAYVAEQGRVAGDLEFTTASFERVLAAGKKGDDIWAHIWSDAALGGEGVVEYVHFRNGIRTRKRAKIDLGEDAAQLAGLTRVNGEFIGIITEEDGTPRELVEFAGSKRHGRERERRFSLAELQAEAVRLTLEDAP